MCSVHGLCLAGSPVVSVLKDAANDPLPSYGQAQSFDIAGAFPRTLTTALCLGVFITSI